MGAESSQLAFLKDLQVTCRGGSVVIHDVHVLIIDDLLCGALHSELAEFNVPSNHAIMFSRTICWYLSKLALLVHATVRWVGQLSKTE